MRKPALLLCAAVLAASLTGCLNLAPLLVGQIEEVEVEDSGRWFEANRIALIDVEGFIGSESGGLLSLAGVTPADVKEKLKRATADHSVKAVVLRINSPGGEVTPSDLIYEEVRAFRARTGKPVVAYMMGTAASGGYYIANAADYSVASPTCMTGSVGVILHVFNVEGLFRKLGLREDVVKSGELKDIGSPTRKMTDEEQAILQGLIDGHFERFVDVVKRGRPEMTEEDLGVVLDGRVLTADQALALHAVDRVGYIEDALAKARELAGIRTADVILYRAFPSYNSNVYAAATAGPALLEETLRVLLRRRGPVFMYLWQTGD